MNTKNTKTKKVLNSAIAENATFENRGKILVSGSVVFDKIFEKNFYGGTGANIAYGLGKLKANPLLFSLVGKDFKKDFGPHLKKAGIDLRVHIDKIGRTASFSGITDKNKGQVEIWKPNTYKKINKIPLRKNISIDELKKTSIAIFSPGTSKSIFKHMTEFRSIAQNATIIFDPGQEVSSFPKKILSRCINLCDIFIANQIEYAQAKKILGKDPRKISEGKIIIKTQGAKGSVIFQNKKIIKVPAVRPKRVLDTTGAGDAYRAGLVFGLWNGLSLLKSCLLGAEMASKNIEHLGCQKY